MSDDDLLHLDASIEIPTQPDPIDAFISSMPEGETRRHCEQTVKLHQELLHHVHCSLIATEPAEIEEHARWVKNMVVEVTYRWGILRAHAVRHAMLTIAPISIRVRNPYR